MSRHILVIEPDLEYAERFPGHDLEREYSIRCPERNGCHGWMLCASQHTVGGVLLGRSKESAKWRASTYGGVAEMRLVTPWREVSDDE